MMCHICVTQTTTKNDYKNNTKTTKDYKKNNKSNQHPIVFGSFQFGGEMCNSQFPSHPLFILLLVFWLPLSLPQYLKAALDPPILTDFPVCFAAQLVLLLYAMTFVPNPG